MSGATGQAAILRSAVYRALALGFGQPGAELGELLGCPDARASFGEVLHALGLQRSRQVITELAAGCIEERTYVRLFGHAARGAVCPFETEYGADPTFRQPTEMADIAGFFAAFGLTVDPGAHERPDHVRCECEFMAFLALKEALADEEGDVEALEVTRAAERSFLGAHLGRFVPAFGASLTREDPRGFYGALGHVLLDLVGSDCARFSVAAGLETLPLRRAGEDEVVPMACGGCSSPEQEPAEA